MGRKTICYRGSLKSCNYRCSYCPFSKHRASVQELEKDRQNFGRFCESIADRAAELIYTLKEHGLEVKRLQFVSGTDGAKPYVVMAEAVKGGKAGVEILPAIVN